MSEQGVTEEKATSWLIIQPTGRNYVVNDIAKVRIARNCGYAVQAIVEHDDARQGAIMTTDVDALITRLREDYINPDARQAAIALRSQADRIKQQALDYVSLFDQCSEQSSRIQALEAKCAELERDAEILRTLIYRTHACDLKFDKHGGVSSLSATFKSNTVPSVGMSDGVRRYLNAFMQDAAIAAQAGSKEGS